MITTPFSVVVHRLRRQPALDRLWSWICGRFTTWPADDFTRFTRSRAAAAPEPLVSALPPDAPPERPPAPTSIAPGTFELRFVRLQQDRSFDAMWEMLAEDAQRCWGSRHDFVDRMRRQSSEYELLEASVDASEIVPQWTDRRRNRTYRNVARLDVRYRIRHGWREVAMRRQVHLVPAAGGWRTLFYPAENAS
ncbi:MAG TPA: hypothetical protein VF134_00750 [Candidatus Dormibacteraeota bacterium]